jgi:hypothetical protein
MRSKQKSTVSKPRLLRAFQGLVTKNSVHFQGLPPTVAVTIWVRSHTLVSPGSQKPRSVAEVPTAPFPAQRQIAASSA